ATFWLGDQNFGHRRPGAAEALVLRQRVAERGSGEALVLSSGVIGRDLESVVYREESIRAEGLSPHRERLEDGEAIAETEIFLAGRQGHCRSGGKDAAPVVAGIEGP